MNTTALIVAAGTSARMGGDMPKQYQPLAGQPLLNHAILAFAAAPCVDAIAVCIHPDHQQVYAHTVAQLPQHVQAKLLPPVMGGATRQASVYNGLQAIQGKYVMIHDAARPFVSRELIMRCHDALVSGAIGVIPALPVNDTLKLCVDLPKSHSDLAEGDCPPRSEGGGGSIPPYIKKEITKTIDRTDLYAAQTPQCFEYQVILQAHEKAALTGFEGTDDASILEAFGEQKPLVIPGDAMNIKLTHKQDFQLAEAMMNPLPDIRSAQGFDIHRFTTGNHIMLGGVKIPHTQGIDAHSDGDVILHALTDAILGLIADGDIGQLFPNTDAQWQGACSDIFVQEAMKRLGAQGGTITHCDITVLSEAPKLKPYRDDIRAHISGLLNLPINRIALKATTMERMGAIGREEGLAAQVLVTGVFQ